METKRETKLHNIKELFPTSAFRLIPIRYSVDTMVKFL